MHGYSILTNHFHLLLRSLRGEISDVMCRVQNRYSRYFNRRMKRDGPLFRGRFWSRQVTTSLDWERVLRYIDRNPVMAKLAARPEDYPYGSAHSFARGRTPPWLEASLVRAIVTYVTDSTGVDGRGYLQVFGRPLTSFEEEYLGAHLHEGPSHRRNDLADLIDAAPPRVLEWMHRKAKLADGREPRALLAATETLMSAVECAQSRGSPPDLGTGHARKVVREALLAGLLRLAGGLGLKEAAMRLGISEATARRRTALHRKLVGGSETYASCAAEIISWALRAEHPGTPIPPEMLGFEV